MRISDWSSDVCSSDLPSRASLRSLLPAPSASSISASSIACITLRTISRSASGSCASNSLTADTAGLISVLVMAGLLGDVEHHQPAMTASLLKRFCRTSRTLPIRSDQSTREVWLQQTIRSQECGDPALRRGGRTEEHTSELQSLMRSSYAVFCLKKKKTKNKNNKQNIQQL